MGRYPRVMGSEHVVVVGDQGQVVIPAEVCQRAGFTEGTTLVLIETADALKLMTQPQLRARIAADLANGDLVNDLQIARRRAAEAEDIGSERWALGSEFRAP